MATAKRQTQTQPIEAAADRLNGAAAVLADRARALEESDHHQRVLIRWLYLIVFVILIVGVGMLFFLNRVDDSVDELHQQQNRIEILVDKVDDNNTILVDLKASLCAIANTLPDIPENLPSCVQE